MLQRKSLASISPLAVLVLVVSTEATARPSTSSLRPQLPMVRLISPAAAPKILHSFGAGSDGLAPRAGLIHDKSGALYGTTLEGGTSCGTCGAVFKLTPAGTSYTESLLYSFLGPPTDGYEPYAGLVADAAGALYGTTSAGGNGTGPGCFNVGCGTVFKLTPSGSGTYTESVLYAFQGGSDGAQPDAGLIIDRHGNLFGTTTIGGATACTYGCGIVFTLTPSGGGLYRESIIFPFPGYLSAGGAYPHGTLIEDRKGVLYGTTDSGGTTCQCGTVFALIPTGSVYTERVLYVFGGSTSGDGQAPMAGVIEDTNGALYGTTQYGGGASCACGTAYKLTPTLSGFYQESFRYSFQGGPTDGASPVAPLVAGKSGALYSTTVSGGSIGNGVVFKLTPSGSTYVESVLHSFGGAPNDGAVPLAGLIFAKGGQLYGTSYNGGTSNLGTVFRIKP